MKLSRLVYTPVASGALALAGCLAGSAQASPGLNPLFGYTHVQPSPLTMPAGRVVFGSAVGLGVTDFLQIGTNLISDIYQTYNANAEINLIDDENVAFAINGGWQSYNPSNYSLNNPNLTITSWQPGAVASFAMGPTLAAFVGGNLNFTTVTQSVAGVDTSGYVRGASSGLDLSWAYLGRRKGRGIGNVLAFGGTYDFTYQIYGVGLSHYWHGLHIGVHYYPNATQYKLYPILAGGAAFDL